MERALLEGEHQTEMGQLQTDQEKINQRRINLEDVVTCLQKFTG